MSKNTKTKAATGEPTAPETADAAASPAPAKKPTLEQRVTALEVKAYGHVPHAAPAEE